MGGWRDFHYFKPSLPRSVKGGIKAQSRRGTFGESWWAQRWIGILEGFHIGARLRRGRSYARSGQVLSIEIEKGKVKAKVQGSRPRPYEVIIQVKQINRAGWNKLAAELSRQAFFMAKLLAREIPRDIEKIFTKAGTSLFPGKVQDLKTNCSCPDWSNPCKHIAAVYYLLGEEFDRDPFLIFKLRGMEREELLKVPDRSATPSAKRRKKTAPPPAREEREQEPVPEPLTQDSVIFWNGRNLPDDFFGEVQVPEVTAAPLKRLGNFPFWRGEENFLIRLEPVYPRAAAKGMEIYLSPFSKNPDNQ